VSDDHDVREHYDDGPDLIDAYRDKRRQLPDDGLPALLALAQPCVVRERCRLRKLQVAHSQLTGDAFTVEPLPLTLRCADHGPASD
jgi:hypothetical protein